MVLFPRTFDRLDLCKKLDDTFESLNVVIVQNLGHLHSAALHREEGSPEEVEETEKTDLVEDLGLFQTGIQ